MSYLIGYTMASGYSAVGLLWSLLSNHFCIL